MRLRGYQTRPTDCNALKLGHIFWNRKYLNQFGQIHPSFLLRKYELGIDCFSLVHLIAYGSLWVNASQSWFYLLQTTLHACTETTVIPASLATTVYWPDKWLITINSWKTTTKLILSRPFQYKVAIQLWISSSVYDFQFRIMTVNDRTHLNPTIAFCTTLFSRPLSYTYDKAATVGPQMIRNKSWSKLLPIPWMYFPSGVPARRNKT